MPIKKRQQTAFVSNVNVPANPLPEVQEPALPMQPAMTADGMLPPTTNHDLNYFFEVAEDNVLADDLGTIPTLVLNLFRKTDLNKKPIAERMILGQDKGAPYYALHATPSLASPDEFNTLQITRRQPLTGNHMPSSTVDILPKLDLSSNGTITVAKIKRNSKTWNVMWNGLKADCSVMLKNSMSIWTEGMPSKNVLIFLFEEGWRSLDDGAVPGGVAVKAVAHRVGQDPAYHDVASLKFGTLAPQFISQSHVAHRLMDVLVAGLFATLIFATRRAGQAAKIHIAQTVAPSSYVPGGTISSPAGPVAGATNTAWSNIEELLTCPICYRIMHHPVSLITSTTGQNAGCLHNFCGACAVDLFQHSDKCPQDRAKIVGINDNRNLSQIIEQYLAANPNEKFSDADIADMDRKYRPGQRCFDTSCANAPGGNDPTKVDALVIEPPKTGVVDQGIEEIMCRISTPRSAIKDAMEVCN